MPNQASVGGWMINCSINYSGQRHAYLDNTVYFMCMMQAYFRNFLNRKIRK
jgi:hypothetical protein